jgi:transposase-like protein
MAPKEPFDLEAFKQQAIKGLYAGQPITGQPINGEKGIFAPLLKQLLAAALEGEMAAHLDGEERQQGNRRNGKANKTVKSAAGEFALSTPGDRSGSFEPQLVTKRQVVISEELEEKVISL